MKKKKHRTRAYAPRRFWSESEIAQLRERYPTTPTKVLAAALGHSVASTYGKAGELGLKKSAEYLAGPDACRLRRGDAIGASTRFQPGLVPWNKGERFVAGGRSPETRFKPGSKPHNWKPVGSYRLSKDGTLQRKVTETGYPPRDWVSVHQLVWVAANGPLPAGHVVVFRPGRRTTDVEQITPDALECVSHAELMKRNSFHRLPKAFAHCVQLRGAITRQINKRMSA